MFYLTLLLGCSDRSLSNLKLLQDHSRITPAWFPDHSGHTSPCSRYAPGGSESQKQREVGLKMERASLEISAANYHNSIHTEYIHTYIMQQFHDHFIRTNSLSRFAIAGFLFPFFSILRFQPTPVPATEPNGIKGLQGKGFTAVDIPARPR